MFLRGLDQKILRYLLLELQLSITPLSLNIFIYYFRQVERLYAEQNNTVFHW